MLQRSHPLRRFYSLPLYKVHFKWKEKEVALRARNLDLTHPYFVSIRDLVFPTGNQLIIDPSQDEIQNTFGKADHLMIPFQTVTLIEEYSDENEESPDQKVRAFTLVDSSDSDADDESPPNDDGRTDHDREDD